MKSDERNYIMNKKLSFLYCTFVPCKSFVLDFFIVEKTFTFYEKILFSEEKTFAIFCFTIFEGRNFRENCESFCPQKFLPLKYIDFLARRMIRFLSKSLIFWYNQCRNIWNELRNLFIYFSFFQCRYVF